MKELFIRIQKVEFNLPKLIFKFFIISFVWVLSWVGIAFIYKVMYFICMVEFEPISFSQAMLEEIVLFYQIFIGWTPVWMLNQSNTYKKLVSLV